MKCRNYRSDLEFQGNIPLKEKNNTSLIIPIGLIVIIILIAILGIGVYGLGSEEIKDKQTKPLVLNINGSGNTNTHHTTKILLNINYEHITEFLVT